MHYHCEIVIPPTSDPAAAVAAIMAPFCEHKQDDEQEDSDGTEFWDWYAIGGRWSGNKEMAKYDPQRLAEFHTILRERKVTVSSIIFGKEELSPASQVQAIDALWNEMFPSNTFRKCPIFKHSNDDAKVLPGDIERLGDVSPRVTCSRVIIAAVDKPKALFMRSSQYWNGCNHEKTDFDGLLSTVLADHRKEHDYIKDEPGFFPTDDWLVVTVDYHS